MSSKGLGPKTARRLVVAVSIPAAVGLWVGCGNDISGPPAPQQVPTTGLVHLATQTGGLSLDADGYRVVLDGGAATPIGINGEVTLRAPVGDHEVTLIDIAENCSVLGSNPRTVRFYAAETRVTIRVACEHLATLTVVSSVTQTATVGALVHEPLAVRVTGPDGEGLEDVEVTWATSGGGALEGRFDGDGYPLGWTSTRTDSTGSTGVAFMPVAFQRMIVTARVACCGGPEVELGVDARDPGASIVVVSGADQSVGVGDLGEPMVVRVANGQGAPTPNVRVDWHVWYGDGALEGRFDDSGNPAVYDHVRTDADGLARISVMPLGLATVVVDASVAGVQGSPESFATNGRDSGATLVVVSGDGQEGVAGDALSEPFVLRVEDSHGRPVPRIRIDWALDQGSGTVRPFTTYGDDDGLHSVVFTPAGVGRARILARLYGESDRAVFEAEASVQRVEFAYDDWIGAPVFYHPTCGWYDYWFECSPLAVPLGTGVEWVNYLGSARLVSTSAPEGGTPFDSGTLGQDDRFRFIPAVAGTWEYADTVSGVTGVLIVR